MSLRTGIGASGGQAAAFTYDLARSVVGTRQGNLAWAGQKRDGAINPIRSDDLFFPDWVDFNKIAIPQADEQQRLLANLITQMSLDRTPLPRFWYLPRGEKAAVVMTGDDHATSKDGTAGQFQWFESVSPAGCSVADWQCVRSTSYAFPGDRLTAAEATAFQSRRLRDRAASEHELRELHARPTLADDWEAQLAEFASAWPSLTQAADQPDALHHLERLGGRGEGRGRERRPARHELLLLAGRVGEQTGPGCSPARASRCASPTRTAR